MFKTIADYFKNHNGKRALFGILLIAAGVYGYLTAKDATVTGVILGLGATLLGLTTADKPTLAGA